jgi:hypothetical protein
MTVDFTALIAYPEDGLITSVDRELFALRRMASSSDKVFQLLNYDIFMNSPFIFRNLSTEKLQGLFFSITEMSVEVTRRNKDNKISMANVKISLVENRNPNINLALIPPLTFTRPLLTCKDKVWAAKHPNKCKKDKATGTFVPISETLRNNAGSTLDAKKLTSQNCYNEKTGRMKFYEKGSTDFPKPCLTKIP